MVLRTKILSRLGVLKDRVTPALGMNVPFLSNRVSKPFERSPHPKLQTMKIPKLTDVKSIKLYTKQQAKKAHADLDQRMSTVPNACGEGCSACCYQMVSVHTWEEELIVSFIQGSMHAKTKTQVRRQMVEWWRDLKSGLRKSTRDDPITLAEVQQLSLRMIADRVMCPFLVDDRCSIYPVRPAMCRAHVVPDKPEQCATEPGRVGDPLGGIHLLATFGPESQHLPFDSYYHAMKPLAFAMTGVFGLAVSSTPMEGLMLGDLLSRI